MLIIILSFFTNLIGFALDLCFPCHFQDHDCFTFFVKIRYGQWGRPFPLDTCAPDLSQPLSPLEAKTARAKTKLRPKSKAKARCKPKAKARGLFQRTKRKLKFGDVLPESEPARAGQHEEGALAALVVDPPQFHEPMPEASEPSSGSHTNGSSGAPAPAVPSPGGDLVEQDACESQPVESKTSDARKRGPTVHHNPDVLQELAPPHRTLHLNCHLTMF